MLAYTIRRLVYMLPIMFGVTAVCFLLVHISPGDPLQAILPPDAPRDLAEELRAAYGLDLPLPIQYLRWLAMILQGDLGTSIATGRSVADEVTGALVNSFLLAGVAAFIAFAAGASMGLLAGYNEGSWIDRLVRLVTIAGVSIPHYWIAMVAVIIFAVMLNWLPAMGAGPRGGSSWQPDWNHLRFMILPALAMSLVPMSILARTLRALVADVNGHDFVEALHAKGLRSSMIFQHVVWNVAPTSVSVMGVQLGYMLGGSILIETVFSWPGTGFLLNSAIFSRDIPLLQGTILVLALIFVILNLLVDILQAWIDPRIKRSANA